MLTRKHSICKTDNEKFLKVASKYSCEKCNKIYAHQSGLCKHRKTCNPASAVTVDDNLTLTELVRELIKSNSELQKQVVELCKNGMQNTTTNNNNTINNNNTNKFNLNLFLNEQCKDALNFNEFMENIQISYQDLENNAQLGFVAGISKIFLDNLNQLGINERPIHCTDVKRETMYIKDENKWTKEPDDSKLQKAIQSVSYKSMGKLMEWKQENPEYQDGNSEFSKRCLDMQKQSLAGSDRVTYYPKVIHTLARETMVDK